MNPQEVRCPNVPAGGLFNLKGKNTGRPSRAVQNLGKVRPAYTKAGCQIRDRLLEGMSVPCHASSVVCDTIKSRGNEIVEVSILNDAVVMISWPQRPFIQAAVLAYRKAHKLNPEQMAEILDVGPSYLHNLLYDKRVWPSLEAAQKLAEVLGLKLGEVVDDPGASIDGLPEESTAVDRFMLKTMGSDLTKLTDAQKQSAMEAWRAIIRGYVRQ